MKLEKYDKVYFLGIGGIGMSALARWFNVNGFFVAGYDRTPSDLTNTLEEEGIIVHFDDNVNSVPENVISDLEHTLFVYTPAIPSQHKVFNYLKGTGVDLFKRAKVLGMLTEGMKCVAVAGTHGKTTTSTMVTHLLKSAGLNVAAFLGGISQNYNTNCLLNDPEKGDPIVVVEADEYDRSFLHLHPDIVAITSVEPDHLDIYEDESDFRNTFVQFANLMEGEKALFVQDDYKYVFDDANLQATTYGLGKGVLKSVFKEVSDGAFVFDYNGDVLIESLKLSLPGVHNVENATAAIAIARQLGVDVDSIRLGVESFGGVKRRFDYHLRECGKVLIDDYAHHPTELKKLIESIEILYPNQQYTLVFQPHLFSRTQDFMTEFVEVLSKVEDLILLPIYPAREEPIEGVTSDVIIEGFGNSNKARVVEKEQLIQELEVSGSDIICIAGAGDIDRFLEPVRQMMEGGQNG